MHKFRKFFDPPKAISFEFVDKEGKECFKVKDRSVNSDGNYIGLAVDPLYSQHFMFNENGFPVNDIVMYETAQSETVANQILQRIQVLHPENAPSGQSLQDLMSQVIPANASTPAEFAKVQEKLATYWYDKQVKLEEQRMQAVQARQAKKAKTVESVEEKVEEK